jgi:hypothetical protein
MTKFTAAEANAFLDAAFQGRGRQNQVILMEEGRAVLRLEADVVEQLSERLWMALQALPDANDGGGGGVAPFAPQTLQYQGFKQQHMRQPQQRF